jgi:hypothetical protein
LDDFTSLFQVARVAPEIRLLEKGATAMAISFYHEFPDMTPAQAQSVLDGLQLNGHSPAGQIFHAEGPLAAGGTWVMDVWESEAALGAFVEKLAPLMQSLGVTPPNPTLLPTRVVLTPQEMRHL